jgi:nucleotide-binding universal stress UspA family protein
MDNSIDPTEDIAVQNERLQGSIIVASQPGQSPRVMTEAIRFAKLLSVPLVVVHVDVTRFVTYEDPDGYLHTAPIDISLVVGEAEFKLVQEEAETALAGSGLTWTARQLAGDPALAIKQLANRLDASLIVVGTRKPGIGESIRQFFTGSVAARLSQRQHRPILVVPQEEPMDDNQELWPDSD